ncbi:HYR domain-containing protein [Geomonas sp. Red69]|uniref:HYR domain-containing protein n=1 Tax=Geomonas diazotrophica TaxID=2843197 RepID=UPI001C12614C|nr:HYR domain-containing protein [Geomonas diazotrophica]MBU5636528.1 HYR domain-containing protein [Geomonas diazotrophica]
MRREILSAIFCILMASTALGGQTCKVIPQVSPDNQDVAEKDARGLATVVKLNASPSKDTTGYLWEQTAGPAVTLSDPTAAQPTFSAPEVGPTGATLVFKLTASGCSPLQRESLTTTVNVKNVATNQAPIAAISVTPSAVYEGSQVTLDGSGSSDPDGNPLSYSWSQLSGPAVTLTTAGAGATFSAPSDVPFPNGTSLSFRLTVSDGSLTGSSDQIVNVLWVNDPPKAGLSCPDSVNEGAQVTLDGSGSTDSDDGIAGYNWSQVLGTPNATLPSYDQATAKSLTFDAPYLDSANDTMTFKLLVSDVGLLTDSRQCSVKVLDITAPVISDLPSDITAEATSAAGAEVSFTLPSARDNVDGNLAVACAPGSGSSFPLGTSTVTCSVSDTAHNGASGNFSVKVQDTTAPVVTPPSPVTKEATGPGTEVAIGTATATDAVGVKAITSDAPPTFPVGITMVTWSASDDAGNVGKATQSVTVQDTTAPVVTAPLAVVVEATAPLSPVAIGTATATDAVGVKGISNNAPALYPVGTTEVTWSADDQAGNVGTAKQIVTVKDTTAPVVTPPASVTVEATGPTMSVTFGTATASDAVGVTSLTNDAPSVFPVGTTVVTWTAKDAAGNTGTAAQSVTVKDTTAPTLNGVPKSLTLITGQAATYDPTATDLVDGTVAVVCTPASGSSFVLGTTAVSCSAKDAHGNGVTARFDVNVQYGFNGLLAPYDANKAYKIKSAIPLKWQFTNSNGAVLASAGAQPNVTIYHVSDSADTDAAITLDDAGASGLQYDSLTNTWQFNWKTTGLPAGIYNVYIQSDLTGQKSGPFPVKLVR